jgi:hypothetical protein
MKTKLTFAEHIDLVIFHQVTRLKSELIIFEGRPMKLASHCHIIGKVGECIVFVN